MTDSLKIEFPCEYPIKIIGVSDTVFRETVVEIVRLHAPNLDEDTGESQLRALHEDLIAQPFVKMVL